MEITDRLAALAHENRLAIFRLLMRRYPDRVPAGDIAVALGLKPNTTSTYLNALRQAGMIVQTREGTSLKYSADLDGARGLFDRLLGGCCQNRPDLCLGVQGATAGDAVMADKQPLNTLFICTGNSARSILAEAILNRLGQGRIRAHSAGTRPRGAPHPEVIALLAAKGYDTEHLSSKSIDTFSGVDAPAMDFVFTVCDHAANEECPTWPGQPMTAHWGLADPVAATGTEAQKRLAYQEAYGLLHNRIAAFTSLPIETLDRMSLQHRLDDIGRMTPADA